MLQTRIYLECNECQAPFPAFNGRPEPLDGALYTTRQLLAEARTTGWQRYGQRDYCPLHELQHRLEAVAGKAGQ